MGPMVATPRARPAIGCSPRRASGESPIQTAPRSAEGTGSVVRRRGAGFEAREAGRRSPQEMESSLTAGMIPRGDVVAGDAEAAAAERLRKLWETPSTLWGWLATVDHKMIGRRYLVTAFVFLVLGGIEAVLM